ncbi:MAG TPA: Zn-ribbon domain-containing OB-fold protein [Firmicutes bacterium]|jgi:uncharacterized OB-fold protein|nr:Zn-ribbon domain-containing OB-fold protein [Bacillota bacterium]
MGFEKFGQVSFTSQTRAAEFVDYLEKGEVRATKCNECGRVFFPPRADCSWCMSSNVEWLEIKGQGKIDSFTKVNYAPTGFEKDVPYILTLADFDGIKVFGRMNKEISEDNVKVGMAVKVAPLTLSEGKITYEFLPA